MATPILPRFEDGRADGASAAAYLAAGVGLLAMSIVVVGTELSASLQAAVFALGKAWIPNAAGIGPYSGKETVMLVAWLGSWAALHLALRSRQVDVRKSFGAALVMVATATLLLWPPVWHALGA